MKSDVACWAFALGMLPVAATAACQHYEYSELKAMKKDALEFAYCEAGLEAKKSNINADTARKLEGLNRSKAYSDIGESVANDRSAEKADDAVEQCHGEMQRIGNLLVSRKTNIAKLRHECHLEE